MELRGEERAEYERKAERMGVVTPDTIKRMKDITESVAKLRGAFRKLGETLVKAGIGDLIDKITASIERFCELPETTQQAVLGLILALLLLPPAFKILKSSWIFFGIFSSPAAKGIKLVARAVLALALALGVTSLLGLGFIGFIGAVIVNMGGLRDALDHGIVAGYPVIDVKATLFDGSYHDVDSSEMAYKIAASMALKAAANKCNPAILEPIMAVEVVAPSEYLGSVMGDVSSRRGAITDQEERGNAICVKAHIPLSEMFGYVTDLRSFTQGRGTYSMKFDHYNEVPKSIAEKIIKNNSSN